MYQQYQNKLFRILAETQILAHDKLLSANQAVAFAGLLEYFYNIKQNNKQVFFIGNGGSAAIASHMAADFMKNGMIKTHSLYDSAVITCMGNDYGYEYVFSKPLGFLGNEGDLLVAISSSGNSPNIIKAIQVAKQKRLNVITFTGFESNNQAKQLGDCNVYVPLCQYGIVESIHNLLLQQVVDTVMEHDGRVV